MEKINKYYKNAYNNPGQYKVEDFKETTDQEEVKKLINMFLDWKNNFLTVGRFAEYYSLTIDKANEVINKGRELNEKRAAEDQNAVLGLFMY